MGGPALLRLAMVLVLLLLALVAWADVLLFLHAFRRRPDEPLYLDHLQGDAKEPRTV